MRTCLILVIVLCSLAGCQAHRPSVKPSLEDQGEIFLYLRPLPQEAANLKFSLESVSAVRDDGSEYPLSLSFHEFNHNTLNRQRFFASAQLPPGNYAGFSVKVLKATLQGEEEEEKLLVPEGPVRLDFQFAVTRKKAAFLSLDFDYGRSVRQGFSFTPVFTISIPGRPVTGLVGYVSNYASNTLTIFDKQKKEVVGVIATGTGPTGIAFDRQRRRAYVSISGEDSVEVVDISLGEITNRIRLKQGDNPQELALTPDGKVLLAVDYGSNTLSFIDPLSYLEVSRLTVGDGPTSILIDPAGVKAYVFNSLSQTISVINIASRSVMLTAASEPGLTRGQFNSRGTVLYTIHEQSPFLRVLSPLLAVQQRDRVGMGIVSLKVDTQTDLIYTGKRYNPQIEVYDPSTFVYPISTVKLDGWALYMAIDNDENNLFAVNDDKNIVQVVNLITREMIAEFDVGESPFRLSLMGER